MGDTEVFTIRFYWRQAENRPWTECQCKTTAAMLLSTRGGQMAQVHTTELRVGDTVYLGRPWDNPPAHIP